MEASRPAQFKITDPDERIVAGWASVEIVDLQRDLIPADVMERAMYKYMDRGGHILYRHSNMPVGKVLRWEIRKHPETKKLGVWIEAKIFDKYEIDNMVWQMIKQGKLKGFSIGGVGKERKVKVKNEDGTESEIDLITEIELNEISIVEEPANPMARIEAINWFAKSLTKDDGYYEYEDIESEPEIYLEVYDVGDGYKAAIVGAYTETVYYETPVCGTPEEARRMAYEDWEAYGHKYIEEEKKKIEEAGERKPYWMKSILPFRERRPYSGEPYAWAELDPNKKIYITIYEEFDGGKKQYYANVERWGDAGIEDVLYQTDKYSMPEEAEDDAMEWWEKHKDSIVSKQLCEWYEVAPGTEIRVCETEDGLYVALVIIGDKEAYRTNEYFTPDEAEEDALEWWMENKKKALGKEYDKAVVIQKPFAGFKNFDECLDYMRQYYDEESARRVCGWLYWQYEGRKKRGKKKKELNIEELVRKHIKYRDAFLRSLEKRGIDLLTLNREIARQVLDIADTISFILVERGKIEKEKEEGV